MVRFSDSREGNEKIDAAPLLDNGKSIVSVDDARSFWDDVFSVDTGYNDIVDDSILSEIYGRYEDEFIFDFEIDDKIDTILEVFGSSEWGSMSESERKSAVDEFVAVLCDKLEIADRPSIKYFDGPINEQGAYNHRSNRIEINSKFLDDPVALVDTVAHETRHGYQHHRAMMQETRMDALYAINFDNYIAPVLLGDGKYLFFADYEDQLVEAEARAFAKLFTKEGDE